LLDCEHVEPQGQSCFTLFFCLSASLLSSLYCLLFCLSASRGGARGGP
jgi:hypothetical protein